jgi:hypothetical protein
LLAECFSCDDKKMKCELECVMPKEIKDEMYAWPLNVPETGEKQARPWHGRLVLSCVFGVPFFLFPTRDYCCAAFYGRVHSICRIACFRQCIAEDVFANCFSLCAEKKSKCADSDETTACKGCLTACATTLDGSMLACVQNQSDTTTGTYGANLDACMNTATGVMDDCRSECSDRCARTPPHPPSPLALYLF